MKYFKVIKGNEFVGILTSDGFRKYQVKHSLLLACTENEGQYVYCENNIYRDNWLAPLNNSVISYELADITEITKEEYDEIYEIIHGGGEIDPEPEPEPTPEPEPEPADITVEYAKKMKIAEMSKTCENIITNGIDVVLSDEKTHHFSLTVQDQLNLITLSEMVKSGLERIPYHADGELCEYYTPQDILAIVQAGTEFKTYHTTYFNSLKKYINSLRSVNTVSQITYGVEIPEKYQSDVWKEINQNVEES